MAENIYQSTYLENALWSNRAKANKKEIHHNFYEHNQIALHNLNTIINGENIKNEQS